MKGMAYGRREDDWTGVQLMRVRDVAMVLGVTERWLRDMVRAGQIASIKMGRRVMIPRSVVEELAHEGLPPSSAKDKR